MSKAILIIGNICKDIIYTTDSYPAEDSKVRALSKETRIGGNAGNIVQVFSQFASCRVDCCIKVGSCEFSKHIKSTLEASGVGVLDVVQPDMTIPESVLIHANDSSSRTCFHYRGNCDDLTSEEVLSVVGDLVEYQWIHLEHRRNGLEVLKLAKIIKSRRPDVMLSIDIEKIREGFEEMLGVVDYPIVSKEVCKTLGYTNMQAALSGLSQHCGHALVVTWGEQGAGMWYSGGTDNLTFNHEKQHKIDDLTLSCDAFAVETIVDSIGAGDCFTAGFIYCVLCLGEQKLPECLLLACKLAASKLCNQGMLVRATTFDF